MSTTPAIRIAGLMKSYGNLEVLRGVDLDVARGSIFALLGSNGAGKTTVVKILSTLLEADGGAAVVNGFNVVAQSSKVRESISLTGQFAAVLDRRLRTEIRERQRHRERVAQLAAGDRLALARGSLSPHRSPTRCRH
jgi:ABC-2 type transport system ATP-binding protein